MDNKLLSLDLIASMLSEENDILALEKIETLGAEFARAKDENARRVENACGVMTASLAKLLAKMKTPESKAGDYGFYLALKNFAKIKASGRKAVIAEALKLTEASNDPNKLRSELLTLGAKNKIEGMNKRNTSANTTPKAEVEAQAVTGKTLTELFMKMTNPELEHVKAEIEGLLNTRALANKAAQEKQAQAPKTPARRTKTA